ncbi:hypothetical protein H0H81_007227 [Sphagnurus paluster]|uniref:Uncharacterized protein n=1 Tax=Sphagnurus paluster TaxID=117069 RepID=A0A9P7K229_9AGAR|nr:hypothetical protein H0H81_007227 [Sphagnurus paluster]
MSASISNLVPIFSSVNWNDWSAKIEEFLGSQELWFYVKGINLKSTAVFHYKTVKDIAGASRSIPIHPAKNAPERLLWDEKDFKAKSFIHICLSTDTQTLFKDVSTSKELWDGLDAKYQQTPLGYLSRLSTSNSGRTKIPPKTLTALLPELA